MIKGWWLEANLWPPTEDMFTQDSSFVVMDDDKPMVAVNLYLTNSKAICYIDGLIGNPIYKQERKKALNFLKPFVDSFVKSKGYKYILAFSEHPNLDTRYRELGFVKTKHNVGSFFREL
jgi:hypothetical protein